MTGGEGIGQARILVVDDHEACVVLLRRILKRAGYTQVSGITDAREVAERVRELHCDLVLLDLHMPHLDGFEVLEQLQAALAGGLGVVLVTGEAGPETRQQAITRGASEVVTKPYDVGEVLDVIETLLTRRRQRS